jgi:hypothetical protein
LSKKETSTTLEILALLAGYVVLVARFYLQAYQILAKRPSSIGSIVRAADLFIQQARVLQQWPWVS